MTPGRKALIIDDSAMLLRYAVNVLGTRMPGLEVLTARRGAEGFYQADKLRPDLILVNHALPDLSGEALCRRLEKHPATATLPIIFLCGQGVDPQTVGAEHPNVVGALTKPFTPEELSNAVRDALVAAPRSAPSSEDFPVATSPSRSRARLQLPVSAPPPERRPDEDPGRIVFRGTTGSFSLKAALVAVVEAHHTGVLRFTVPAAGNEGQADAPGTLSPTEVYLRDGKVALVTTRDPDRCPVTSPHPVDAVEAFRREQRATGCPPFLSLLAAGRMSEAEALLATSDHGQRLFAQLWTRPRVDFEFERLAELPPFLRSLPAKTPVAPAPAPAPDLEGLDTAAREAVWLDDWLLGTLRRLRPNDLPELDGVREARFDGVPAYTREGYTAIRRLQLTDLEAAFARQINGRADLRTLADRLGLGLPATFLVLFRFRSVEIVDLWPAGALTPHPAETTPAGSDHHGDSPVDICG